MKALYSKYLAVKKIKILSSKRFNHQLENFKGYFYFALRYPEQIMGLYYQRLKATRKLVKGVNLLIYHFFKELILFCNLQNYKSNMAEFMVTMHTFHKRFFMKRVRNCFHRIYEVSQRSKKFWKMYTMIDIAYKNWDLYKKYDQRVYLRRIARKNHLVNLAFCLADRLRRIKFRYRKILFKHLYRFSQRWTPLERSLNKIEKFMKIKKRAIFSYIF